MRLFLNRDDDMLRSEGRDLTKGFVEVARPDDGGSGRVIVPACCRINGVQSSQGLSADQVPSKMEEGIDYLNTLRCGTSGWLQRTAGCPSDSFFSRASRLISST